MSLRHALIGLLAAKPSSGYEVTQRFDESLRHAWHASHSQIYPELAKLQDEGLVEVVGEGPRNSRTWATTAAGREELRRWLVETDPNRNVRNETALRWFLAMLLEPGDRRAVLEREIAFMRAELAALEELNARIDELPEVPPFGRVARLGPRTSPVMIQWLQEQLDDAGED